MATKPLTKSKFQLRKWTCFVIIGKHLYVLWCKQCVVKQFDRYNAIFMNPPPFLLYIERLINIRWRRSMNNSSVTVSYCYWYCFLPPFNW